MGPKSPIRLPGGPLIECKSPGPRCWSQTCGRWAGPLYRSVLKDRFMSPSNCIEYLEANISQHQRVLDRDVAGETASTPLGFALPLLLRLESVRGYNPLDIHRYKEFIQFIGDRADRWIQVGASSIFRSSTSPCSIFSASATCYSRVATRNWQENAKTSITIHDGKRGVKTQIRGHFSSWPEVCNDFRDTRCMRTVRYFHERSWFRVPSRYPPATPPRGSQTGRPPTGRVPGGHSGRARLDTSSGSG